MLRSMRFIFSLLFNGQHKVPCSFMRMHIMSLKNTLPVGITLVVILISLLVDGCANSPRDTRINAVCTPKKVSPHPIVKKNYPAAKQSASVAVRSDFTQPVKQAFTFLSTLMDEYHKQTVIYAEPYYSAYYPSGHMGDRAGLVVNAFDDNKPNTGLTSLRIEYKPSGLVDDRWAGVYFQYPDKNWGKRAGRDLSDATELTFNLRTDAARKVKIVLGGVNAERLEPEDKPCVDSLGRIETTVLATEKWKEYKVNLASADKRSVIGPFGIVLNAEDNESAMVQLDNIVINHNTTNEPRFIQSYIHKTYSAKKALNSAYLYDQALAALAFMSRATQDDLYRAELILQAMLEVQKHDVMFNGSRLRNAYASGELFDADTGHIRLAGVWDEESREYKQDAYAIGTDTGNMAWAGLALIQGYHLLDKQQDLTFKEAALRIANWIVDYHKVDDALAGFSGGCNGKQTGKAPGCHGQQKVNYRSVEHNIDLVAFFKHLAYSEGTQTEQGQYWLAQMKHAQQFVEKMRAKNEPGKIWVGTCDGKCEDGKMINQSTLALDVFTWTVLALAKDDYADALRWATTHCQSALHDNAYSYTCSDGKDHCTTQWQQCAKKGSWWEGTAQLALADYWLHNQVTDHYNAVMSQIIQMQIEGDTWPGAFEAATLGENCLCLDTCFGWCYYSNLHIGATSWFIFAALGKNPYYLYNLGE